jgi:hypothetical protein
MYFLLNRWTTTRLLGGISISDFIPAKAVLLRRLLPPDLYHSIGPVSTRETVMQIWFTMNTLWTTVLLLDSIHTALAIFFVYVIRIDIPDDWPDLFGSPLEAFTLGRFWSMYVYIRRYSRMSKLMRFQGIGTVFT